MKKKTCIMLTALLLAGGLSLFAKKEIGSVLHIRYGTDKVQIALHDSADTEGYVVPGQIRDINMAVENLSARSRIRWKAEIRVNENEILPLKKEDLVSVSSCWKFHEDGYYYGTDSADTDETVPMFEKLRMPIEIIDAMAEGDIVSVVVTAEAVQDENNDASWNELEIQDSEEKILGVE